MKKLLKKLEWWFDVYVAHLLYNGNKRDRYISYMKSKWDK
jgi:hypothetical protein